MELENILTEGLDEQNLFQNHVLYKIFDDESLKNKFQKIELSKYFEERNFEK